jgi:biotin synthase
VPIAGTRLEDRKPVSLWEAVKIIALARFIMPDRDIKLGAGRPEIFRDAQHLVFLAGANGMIVGDLLTVKGRQVEDDLRVASDLGLRITA